jgi:2-polyprenyl-6-methoxyphenol hydroxylase-like FAD-dependent oxidoreductase
MNTLAINMNKSYRKKAIIIGSGIAGPAMALQLQKLNIETEIFEARPGHKMNQGVFLGITPNGLNVLSELIDLESLKEDYTPGKMCFYNARGKHIGELDTKHQIEKYGAETIQIKRATIGEQLRKEASGKGIPIHFGKNLVDLNQNEDGVTARFADGTEETADFLIACDGTHSVCRKKLFPDAPEPVYTRQLSTGAFVNMEGMEPHFGSINMTFGRRAFFAWAVSNKNEVWWFNNFYREKEPTREELHSTLQTEIKNHLLDIHKDDPKPIYEIIQATEDMFVYPVYDIPSLPKWHKGNVCLIGDAAHATAPHIGQGASLALEDTVVLAACIRDHPSLTNAFDAFQKLRQPRVEKLIKTARKVGSNKSKPNPVETFFRDLLLKHFIRFESKKMDWVYGYRFDM